MEVQEPSQTQVPKPAELVEENCEYLVHLYNIQQPRNGSLSNTLKSISVEEEAEGEEERRRARPSYEDILQLLVELCYFLYACKMFGKALDINWEDIKEEGFACKGEKRFKIVLFYKIKEGGMEDDFSPYELFQNILEHIDKYLSKFYKDTDPPDSRTEQEHLDTYKKFVAQMSDLDKSDLNDNEGSVFSAIEQTDLFYLHSLLYRIRNCSLLDLIRTSPKNLSLFKEARKKDLELFTEFSQEKKKMKGSQEILKQKEREIDGNILTFFQQLETIRFKEIHDHSSRINFVVFFREKDKKSFDELLGRMNTENAQLELKRPKGELEYTVECSAERNSISVRLLMPSIVVNADTSDFLMYQSNVLACDEGSVSIELKEMEEEKEKREAERRTNGEDRQYPPLLKYVVFKSTSSFNVKEPILEKILTLMDSTMIASRLYEVEMNPQNYFHGNIKDTYQRTSVIASKIQHYTKFFSRCSKRVYNTQ